MPKIPKPPTGKPEVAAPKDEEPTPSAPLSLKTPQEDPHSDDVLEGVGGFSILKGLEKLAQLTAPPKGRRRRGSPHASPTPPKPVIDDTGELLYRHIRRQPNALFSTMAYTMVPGRFGEPTPLSVDARIAALEQILVEHPNSSIEDRDSALYTLAHHIVLNPEISGAEQEKLIHYLASRGFDFSKRNDALLSPLDLAINLTDIEPQAINALLDHHAPFDLETRLKIIGHLTGLDGKLTVKVNGQEGKVHLVMMAPKDAEYGLDPAFRTALREAHSQAPPPLKAVFEAVEERWTDNRNFPPLIETIQTAPTPEGSNRPLPRVVITGWFLPVGHAIGFVSAHEKDGVYIYACNTGPKADKKRSIVRYRVTDPDLAGGFFQACAQDRNKTRALFTEKPRDFGLKKCPEAEQIPLELDKSFQKRENCPITARKACLLAMLWSEGAHHDLDDNTIKGAYKEITSLLRRYGAELALAENNPQLMGKTIIKLLTKFDRPGMEPLAYQLAAAIIKHHEQGQQQAIHSPPSEIPPSESDEYLTTLQTALALTGEDPNSMFERYGRTLVEHARAKDNPRAAQILKRLSKPTPRYQKYLRLEFWESLLNS